MKNTRQRDMHCPFLELLALWLALSVRPQRHRDPLTPLPPIATCRERGWGERHARQQVCCSCLALTNERAMANRDVERHGTGFERSGGEPSLRVGWRHGVDEAMVERASKRANRKRDPLLSLTATHLESPSALGFSLCCPLRAIVNLLCF